MPYLYTAKALATNATVQEQLIRELDTLKADLVDMRAKYAILLAKLDADAGVTDTTYVSLAGLASATFVKT